MIKKYLEMTAPIEALQYTGDNKEEMFRFGKYRIHDHWPRTENLLIDTTDGRIDLRPGDYLIKDWEGNYLPVLKEVFEESYVEYVE